MLPTMEQTPVLSKSCPHCDFKMPEAAAFCPGCGRSMQSAVRSHGKVVGVLPENIAGALAYFTFVPAIAFLFVEPYRRNQFVRFHSIQCLLLCGAAIVVAAILRLAGLVFLFLPVVGPLVAVLLDVVSALALTVIWLVLVVKALQGETRVFPVLGDLAERYADPL